MKRIIGVDPPHAAAQLMQLGQAEAVGVQDDHHGGLGHVHPHLDDGGGHQDGSSAGGESHHGGGLVLAAHTPGEDSDVDALQGGLGLQPLPPLLDGGQRTVGTRGGLLERKQP